MVTGDNLKIDFSDYDETIEDFLGYITAWSAQFDMDKSDVVEAYKTIAITELANAIDSISKHDSGDTPGHVPAIGEAIIMASKDLCDAITERECE